MDSKQFTADALRTESKPETLAFSKGGTFVLLKLLAASAEVADTCKRGIFYGKPLDTEKLNRQLNQLKDELALFQLVVDNGVLDSPGAVSECLFPPNLRLLHASIGIFGESGEMISALIEQMDSGKLDLTNFAEEVGDVDWYKAIAHDETGVSEEVTRAAVIAKLKARYGEKFSADAASNRNLEAERVVLESKIEGAK